MASENHDEPATGPAPYLSEPPVRRPLDLDRPWLDGGLSWSAAADRLATYTDHRTGRPRNRLATWWKGGDPEESRLRRRAAGCRQNAEQLDRLTARGWVAWHDRLVPGSRNVLDHVLIGPAGVVVLQTIPVYDHVTVEGRVHPGQLTATALAHSMNLLASQVVEPIATAARIFMPGWNVPTYGHNVLVGDRVRGNYENSIRPEAVPEYLASLGAPYSPTHVQDLALSIEDLFVLAPLEG